MQKTLIAFCYQTWVSLGEWGNFPHLKKIVTKHARKEGKFFKKIEV